MQGLLGTYNHKLDAKGRLTLPASFRKALPEDLVVTVSPKRDCLYVFDQPGFTAWVDSLFDHEDGYDAGNERHADVRLVLNSLAKPVEVDSAHRIGLSADQCADVGLEKDVVIVGDNDHFTVWDAKRWNGFFAEVDTASILKKR